MNVQNPTEKTYKRKIWNYNYGNYDGFRNEASHFDWNILNHTDIDIFAQNITNKILNLTETYIPNKTVTIRQSHHSWMHNEIRKLIRKLKRAYDKAKIMNSHENWNTYKLLRNKTKHLVRNARTHHSQTLADKVRERNLTTTDYWKILKGFISSTRASSEIVNLLDNGKLISDDNEKADLLHNFFQAQTKLNDHNKHLSEAQIDPN